MVRDIRERGCCSLLVKIRFARGKRQFLTPQICHLLPLASRRLCQGYLHDSCTFKATVDGIVKGIHVFGQESLTDSPQSLYLLVSVRHHLCPSDSHCRFILERKAAILWPDSRGASGDCRQSHIRIVGYAVQLFSLQCTMKVELLFVCAGQRQRYTVRQAWLCIRLALPFRSSLAKSLPE